MSLSLIVFLLEWNAHCVQLFISFDPLKAVVVSCCAFVKITACATRLWVLHTLSPEILHFFKTIYYFTVFLVKSLHSLSNVTSSTSTRDRQYRALLISTCTYWFDSLAFSVMKAIQAYTADGGYRSAEIAELQLAMSSVFLL